MVEASIHSRVSMAGVDECACECCDFFVDSGNTTWWVAVRHTHSVAFDQDE